MLKVSVGVRKIKAEAVERMTKAVRLKNAGHTYRDIGQTLGCSHERARQLVCIAYSMQEIDEVLHVPRCELSERAVNALKYAGLTPEQIKNMTTGEIARLRNIGILTARQIRQVFPYAGQKDNEGGLGSTARPWGF